MKFKGFMGVAVLVGLLIFGFSAKVNAIDETQVETLEENKSGIAEWMDKDLNGLIINVAASISGTVIAMAAFLKSINALKSAFKKSGEENSNSAKIMKDCEKEIKENNTATQIAIEQNNNETLKAIQEDNAATRAEIERLTKVFGIAFSNDSKLVKNGAASEIMKVLGDSNENIEA